jgi:hypothetical protein
VTRRQLFAHLFLHLGVFRIVGEILPFPAIALVIVELLGSVGVGDIAVALGSQAEVLVAEVWGIGGYRSLWLRPVLPKKDNPLFSPMDSAKPRFPRPFRQKKIPSG